MIELRKVALNPWDFTLYRSNEGAHALRVVFSEGEYKMDVERYFVIDTPLDPSYPLGELQALSARIRAEYPDTALRQVRKSDLTIIT
jgi:hypothetical protein